MRAEPNDSTSDSALFLGTWRLASFESDERTMASEGAHPIGMLMYDATGHMAGQIQPDRPRASWPPEQLPTPQQALDAVNGYWAYFGTYAVNERAKTVTHHREAALNFDAVEYVRRYEFQGRDRLVLVPVESAESRLVWERVR